MKKIIFVITSILLLAFASYANSSPEDYTYEYDDIHKLCTKIGSSQLEMMSQGLEEGFMKIKEVIETKNSKTTIMSTEDGFLFYFMDSLETCNQYNDKITKNPK